MKIQSVNAKCGKCQAEFQAELVVEAPVELFCESLKAIRCPKCGAASRHCFLLTGSPKPVEEG